MSDCLEHKLDGFVTYEGETRAVVTKITEDGPQTDLYTEADISDFLDGGEGQTPEDIQSFRDMLEGMYKTYSDGISPVALESEAAKDAHLKEVNEEQLRCGEVEVTEPLPECDPLDINATCGPWQNQP